MNHQDTIESDSMPMDVDDPRQLAFDEDHLGLDESPTQPFMAADQETGHLNQSHALTVQNGGSEPSDVRKRGRQHSSSSRTIPEASAGEESLTVRRYASSPPTPTAVRSTIPLPGAITADEYGPVIPQELTFSRVDIRLPGRGEQSLMVLFAPPRRVAMIWSHGINDRLPALSDRTLPPLPFEEDSD